MYYIVSLKLHSIADSFYKQVRAEIVFKLQNFHFIICFPASSSIAWLYPTFNCSIINSNTLVHAFLHLSSNTSPSSFSQTYSIASVNTSQYSGLNPPNSTCCFPSPISKGPKYMYRLLMLSIAAPTACMNREAWPLKSWSFRSNSPSLFRNGNNCFRSGLSSKILSNTRVPL